MFFQKPCRGGLWEESSAPQVAGFLRILSNANEWRSKKPESELRQGRGSWAGVVTREGRPSNQMMGLAVSVLVSGFAVA